MTPNLKGQYMSSTKIIEENIPNLKKEVPWTNKKPTELQIEWTRKEILPIT